MSDYNLTYIRRSDEKEFKGKTLIQGESVVLLNPETGLPEEFKKSRLRKLFKCSKDNRYKNKPVRCRPTVKSIRPRGKLWEEYLNGTG